MNKLKKVKKMLRKYILLRFKEKMCPAVHILIATFFLKVIGNK